MAKVLESTIRSEIKELTFIYMFARECHQVTNYFNNPNISEENEIVVAKRNIQLVNFVFWRTHIIELAKLVTERNGEKYNVFKLFTRLKKNRICEPGNSF